MSQRIHPERVLYKGEEPFPMLPACDHYAGSEKLMLKSLALQRELGPIFDVTCDCEDGAPAGGEREHAQLVASVIAGADNTFGRVGVRIHDISHAHWRDDLDIIVRGAGRRLAFITLSKATATEDVSTMLAALSEVSAAAGLERPIPVHVLIETHGALREVFRIAALPQVEGIDFGLMDFVSAHHGAIPAAAMKSPGQFEHPLIVRAKCEIAAAALAAGVVPAHNVTTELRDSTSYVTTRAARAMNSASCACGAFIPIRYGPSSRPCNPTSSKPRRRPKYCSPPLTPIGDRSDTTAACTTGRRTAITGLCCSVPRLLASICRPKRATLSSRRTHRSQTRRRSNERSSDEVLPQAVRRSGSDHDAGRGQR